MVGLHYNKHLTVMGGDRNSWILVDKYVQHEMIKNGMLKTDEVEDKTFGPYMPHIC